MTDKHERYMIDDAGTLKDKKTCTCYDYLEEILPILNQQEKRIKELETENKQLKKDRFICLDCKYCGYTEIGCLCEKQDHWEEFKNECNDFKELKY